MLKDLFAFLGILVKLSEERLLFIKGIKQSTEMLIYCK